MSFGKFLNKFRRVLCCLFSCSVFHGLLFLSPNIRRILIKDMVTYRGIRESPSVSTATRTAVVPCIPVVSN